MFWKKKKVVIEQTTYEAGRHHAAEDKLSKLVEEYEKFKNMWKETKMENERLRYLCRCQKQEIIKKNRLLVEKNSLLSQIEESTHALKDAFRTTDDNFQSSQEELREKEKSINSLKKIKTNLVVTKERTENELWRLRRELSQIGELIIQHNEDMSLLKDRLTDTKERNNDLCDELDEVESTNQQLVDELDSVVAELETIKTDHEDTQQELKACREWNEKLCEQFLQSEMRNQELVNQLNGTVEEHTHYLEVEGKLVNKQKEVVIKGEQLKDIKSRDERVALLLLKLASSIKSQVKKPSKPKNCIMYPFQQIVPKKKKPNTKNGVKNYLFDERFGMVQELLGEFVHAC
ncbi:chromosome partition protein Smc-like [Clytia hemisphaerica]|uniref:Uncharacterized protein n=1 Tax=Clytia hemisphaerica TaxID=252671 RepID=A0A7M5WZR5_9CNID|eukprot:TCONS_00015420-protein